MLCNGWARSGNCFEVDDVAPLDPQGPEDPSDLRVKGTFSRSMGNGVVSVMSSSSLARTAELVEFDFPLSTVISPSADLH
mmetsp:Transcript_49227/g.101555  ORF Transcript_49227/g.101555 Transcript_49227/m.101555 type:complete len:80 (+) Transcript_49227:1176-1415(+)